MEFNFSDLIDQRNDQIGLKADMLDLVFVEK
jgi:hypothetical protein